MLAILLVAALAAFTQEAVAMESASDSGSTSVYKVMPHDPTAVVLGSPEFPVHGDGVGDDTASIQAAVDEASRRGGENFIGNIIGGSRGLEIGDGGGVVFVPEGRYRISDTIDLHASVRIIGFGDERPEFYLGEKTPGFQEGQASHMFAALRRPIGSTRTFGNNDTFGTGLINVNITIADGNPAAVGVRFGGAQLFILQDVDINVGSGYAGIDHNANLIQRVNIRGGEVGLLAFAASPGWQTTLLDTTFQGQRDVAIRLHTDSKLSIIRGRFQDAKAGIEATPAQNQRLYIQDSVFQDLEGAAITLNDNESIPADEEQNLVRAQNQLNVVNTGIVNTPALLVLQPSGRTWTGPASSYLVEDATHGLRVHDALGDDEQRFDGVSVAAHPTAPPALRRLRRSDIPLPPESGTWVNIAEYAAAHGVEIGDGEDDHAIFQQAIDEHETVYVPMGQYVIGDTLELGPNSNLIGLHPRQTWLTVPDEDPAFSDPENPKAIIHTPIDGTNHVSGLGLDTARHTPGAVQVHWQAGKQSHLSDVTTQFVKWFPEETDPDDPGPGDPGYQYRGRHKYGFWIDGGGGTLVNLWSVNGWADNGLLIENTTVPGRVYEVSIEHHENREVVLRNVSDWEFHALQTEDHIYGWRSQAIELDDVHDVLFGNTVLFRVATVQGPYPYAIGTRESSNIVVRGTRGYRPINIENTRWQATIVDVDTGRVVPEIEIAYLGVGVSGEEPPTSGIGMELSQSEHGAMPGDSITTTARIDNGGSTTIRNISLSGELPDGWTAEVAEPPTQLAPDQSAEVDIVVQVPPDTPSPSEEVIDVVIEFLVGGDEQRVILPWRIAVGPRNLAAGVEVVASSTLSTNVAAHAVDGARTGSRWISGRGDPLPTLTLDLGRPSNLEWVELYNGVTGSDAFRVRSFRVETLVDSTWTPVGEVTGNDLSPAIVDISDAPKGIRHLRLVFTEPSPSDELARVFEVEVYGTQ